VRRHVCNVAADEFAFTPVSQISKHSKKKSTALKKIFIKTVLEEPANIKKLK
jgi:hypothetical protein